MKKYIFYRDKKITWLLCLSCLLIIINDVTALFYDAEKYSSTNYIGTLLFTVVIMSLIFIGIIYKSVSVCTIDYSGVTHGIIIKKKMFFSRIAEINSSEKYITFVSLKNGRKTFLNISIYILLNNIDLYKDFFEKLMLNIDIDEVSIDKKTKDILFGRRLLTIENLNTPHPKIGGWLLYFVVGFIALAFRETISLTELVISYSVAFDGWDILQVAAIIYSIVFIGFSIFVSILIFKRKKIAPRVLIANEWVKVLLVAVLAILTLAVGIINGEGASWKQYLKYLFTISNAIIMALVYTRYYIISIRVKKTFGLMSDEEYKKIYGDYSTYEASCDENENRQQEVSFQGANEEFGVMSKLDDAKHKPKRSLNEKDFESVKKNISNITDHDKSSKITFMFFGKVKYYLAKEWYKETKKALKDDGIVINKIVASPDCFEKNYMGYKPSDEYEKTYFDQMFVDKNGVQFKCLGFLCTYDESYDYITDSHCFGEMRWGEEIYPEGMKLSFDKRTASQIDIFKYLEIFNKYISLFHLHIFEIDYGKRVKLIEYNGDFVENNKSKKLILDLEM